jgi:hypothetical protein
MQKCCVIFLSIILFGCNQPEPPINQPTPNYYAFCNLESLYDLKYLENVDSIFCLNIYPTESKLLPIILKSIGRTKVKHLYILTDSLIINENIEIQGLVSLDLWATRYAELKGSIISRDLKDIGLSYLNVDDSNFLKDKKLRTITLQCDSNGIPGMISSLSSVEFLNIYGYFENEPDLSSIKNVTHDIWINNRNKNVHLSLEKMKKTLLKSNSPDLSVYLDVEME